MAGEKQIGNITSRPALPELSTTNTEFDAILSRMTQIVRENSEFNDFLGHGNTVLIQELIAYVAALLGFKQDFNVNQAFLPTAVSPEAVTRLLEQLGISLARPRPGFTPVQVAIVDKDGAGVRPLVVSRAQSPLRLSGRNRDGGQVTYELYNAEFENELTGVARDILGFFLLDFQNPSAPESFRSADLLSQIDRFPELDPTGFYRVEPGTVLLKWTYLNDSTIYTAVDTPSTEFPNLGVFVHPRLVSNITDPLSSATVINYNTGLLNILFDSTFGVPISDPSVAPSVSYTLEELQPVPLLSTVGSADLVLEQVSSGNGKLALAVEGRTVFDRFISDATVNQAFALSRFPVISSELSLFSVAVGKIDEKGEFVGTPWDEISSVALTNVEAVKKQVYELTTNEAFQVTLRFGNGVTGDVPPDGSIIQVRYRIGGGLRGVVAPHVLDRNLTIGQERTTYTLRVENPNPVANATDGEDPDRARELAPQFFATQERAVTGQDYTVIANRFPEADVRALATVVKATAAANVIRFYVLKRVAAAEEILTTLTVVDKRRMIKYINGFRMETDILEVIDGEIVNVNLTLDIYVAPNGNIADIVTQMENAIALFFSLDEPSGPIFGKDFRLSEFLAAVRCNVSDVLWVAPKDVSGTAFRPLLSIDQSNPCGLPPAGDPVIFNASRNVLPLEISQIYVRGCIVLNPIQES